MGAWSNPWTIGIGTAIISGLIVNLISSVVGSVRSRRKAQSKVDTASTDAMPSLHVVLAEDSLLDLQRIIRQSHVEPDRKEDTVIEPELLDEDVREYSEADRKSYGAKLLLLASAAAIVLVVRIAVADEVTRGIYAAVFGELWPLFVLLICSLIIWSYIHKWFSEL